MTLALSKDLVLDRGTVVYTRMGRKKSPPPGEVISANVYWGKNTKGKRIQERNVKEKGKERERKRANGK
jgi:hypothetical protein